MVDGKIKLIGPERFEIGYEINKEKLEGAAAKATDKLKEFAKKNAYYMFPGTSSAKYKYPMGENKNWECGMYTGCFWLAYLLTGELKFRKIAEKHFETYVNAYENNVSFNDHDVGFRHSPSVIAEYKITGNEAAGELAKKALEVYYKNQYTEKGKFILRSNGEEWPKHQTGWCRTMMDTLMNTSFLFWGYKETGDEKYRKAAYSQINTTNNLLIREDGSSYHHYQFNPNTMEPMYGLTLQGYSGDSTWSRGQAWGMYGPLLTYIYIQDSAAIDTFKATVDYYLRYLPEDYVPYWDLSFTSGDEPRDSSSAAIALCAILEGIRHLDALDPDREVYISAAKNIMSSLIDNYITSGVPEANGLLLHATYSKPDGLGVDEMNIWGDYFYIEALHRMLDPEWEPYW